MKVVDTNTYISMLRELVEQGKEVSLLITGSSMSPFLIHERDYIYFERPSRRLWKGDMVFYQRDNGQYVMHRIWRVKPDGFYIVGDAQTEIEGPVRGDQIFAVITKVKRDGQWIKPGDFWWEFFEHVWIHMIKVRRPLINFYGKLTKRHS